MDQISTSRKRSHIHPKDWERRMRVLAALSAKRMTVTELAEVLERSQGYVPATIWGVDRHFVTESAIADVLGQNWHDLFASGHAEEVAA